MFSNLKLGEHKGLKGVWLRELGRINIICGKNNCGKSTLLEAIELKDLSWPALKLRDGEVERLYKESSPNVGWHPNNQRASNRFKEILLEVAASRELWLEEDADRYGQEVYTLFNANGLTWSHNSHIVIDSFYGLFRELRNLPTILLPPKRQLQLGVKVQATEEVLPGGNGILNYLFYARNQDESSKDKALLERIHKAFTKISSGYRFDVFMSKNNELRLSFAYKNRSWITAENCGLGLQDLLMILYFAIGSRFVVVLIEEPESHLHPDMQRRLLFFLREETDKQFFMTTHSNVFLNNAMLDRVFFTSFKDSIVVDDATSRASILDDLGYSVTDNLVSDLIILVEGPGLTHYRRILN